MNVLIVEDDPSVLSILTQTATEAGYCVQTATDGAKACELALSAHFDLILLDLMLPGVDGYEVCRRVRATSMVPIIMLTARDDEIDKVLGLELGADDYVTKPFSVA